MYRQLPINFRAFLIVALCVAGALACAYAYFALRALGIALACVYSITLAIFATVFTVRYFRGKTKLRVVIALAVSTVLSICAFSLAATYFDAWNDNSELSGFRYVSGRVCAVDTRSGDYKIDLEDLCIDGKNAKGILRISITAADNNVAEIVDYGDTLSFYAYLSAAKLFDDGKVNGTAYRTDIRFYATLRSENIKIEFGYPTVIEKFLSYLHKLLTENMGEHYGNIAFSMLTGDKHELNSDVSDYYSAAGLGHIMAVSGLHIGFLTLLLNLLLTKIDKRIRFPIITAVLICYMALADFSPSVVRAVVMAEISMLSLFVGGRRDLLSSLLCAFSVILAVKPLYIFEIGFILSFGAIFGIAMFSNSIARFLVKHKSHKKIADSVGTAVSVQTGIIPAQIYFFHKIQIVAVLINIVLIPYIAVVFISVVCCSVIGSIPHCGCVLTVCKYLLMPIDYIAYGISSIPDSQIMIYSTSAVYLCYPVMFLASEYFMMPRGKSAFAAYSAAVYLAFSLIGAPKLDNMIFVGTSNSNESVVCVDGQVYVVGYLDDEYSVRELLIDNRCKRIDGIFLLDLNGDSMDNIIELNNTFSIDRIYYYESNYASDILCDNGLNFETYVGDGIFDVYYHNGEFSGYIYDEILFAVDGADELPFALFRAVRIKSMTVDDVVYGKTTYLCNYSSLEYDNIYTINNGAYSFAL